MAKESAHHPCTLCGNPEGNDVVRTTLYENVTKHRGYVCKNCRRDSPL